MPLGMGAPELIILSIGVVIVIVILWAIGVFRSGPRGVDGRKANQMPYSPVPDPPSPGSNQTVSLERMPSGVKVRLNREKERVSVATEVVRVPTGATITVKRSRTIEHSVDVDWRIAGGGGIELGFKQVVTASIHGEIERTLGRSYQQSETTEYAVELRGGEANQYRLTWTEQWLSGLAEIRDGRKTRSLPFRFRERTELEVAAVSDAASRPGSG